MTNHKTGHKVAPFGINRRMAAASAAVSRESNTIHTLTEVDISQARRLIARHRERTGERLSLTAYVVTCLARAVAENPTFNARRKGGSLVILDDVTISTLVERDLGGEPVPEPVGIQAADKKSYRQIHDEIRVAQQAEQDQLGALSGMTWVVRFVPSFLFKAFIRLAARNIGMAKRYGVVAVTAVGMFGKGPLWLVPLSSATVTVVVGGIVERPVWVDGRFEPREHLCLTLSFDHEIIDGAPAARFTARLSDLLTRADILRAEVDPGSEA